MGLPGSPWKTPLLRTLFTLHWRALLWQQLLCLGEVAQALITPVLLREFLRWLEVATQDHDDGGEGAPPVWRGWVLAAALGLSGISIPLMMHHHNWSGVRTALRMRQQAIAAIHAKILRMTPSPDAAAAGGGGSGLSSGYVSTLIGADVRRFDDVMPYLPYLLASPLQLVAVIVMVGLELDFVSAVAGTSISLALIPLQAALAAYISDLRTARARCTDERVRLMAEVVEGHLAVKMCGLEGSFGARIGELRALEAAQVRRSARIRAVNLALYTSVSALIAFVTFSVHRARGDALNVSSVFYALSLLQLPAAYLVHNFVTARALPAAAAAARGGCVAMHGGDFDWRWPLGRPELAPSAQVLQLLAAAEEEEGEGAAEGGGAGGSSCMVGSSGTAAGAAASCFGCGCGGGGGGGGSGGWAESKGRQLARVYDLDLRPPGAHDTATVCIELGPDVGCVAAFPPAARDAAGLGITARGGSRSQREGTAHKAAFCMTPAAPGGDAAVGIVQPAAEAADDVGKMRAPSYYHQQQQQPYGDTAATLSGVVFRAAPGELLGVCGATGSGKSTLLAALLGQLQPMQQPMQHKQQSGAGAVEGGGGGAVEGAGGGGVEVYGSVAYCAQVPWIMAGSVRDNITFGLPYEPEWYGRVLGACCLHEDLARLAGGDQAELGEGGAGLSGGQKARVALARACYCRPAVALLDDPLSAVDAAVGVALWERVLGPGGLLAAECGATRLLVTHQERFLPLFDRVLLLSGGRQAALGPWSRVAQLRRELSAATGAKGADRAEEASDSGGNNRTGSPPSAAAPLVSGVGLAAAAVGFGDAAAQRHGMGSRRLHEPPTAAPEAPGRPAGLLAEPSTGGENGAAAAPAAGEAVAETEVEAPPAAAPHSSSSSSSSSRATAAAAAAAAAAAHGLARELHPPAGCDAGSSTAAHLDSKAPPTPGRRQRPRPPLLTIPAAAIDAGWGSGILSDEFRARDDEDSDATAASTPPPGSPSVGASAAVAGANAAAAAAGAAARAPTSSRSGSSRMPPLAVRRLATWGGPAAGHHQPSRLQRLNSHVDGGLSDRPDDHSPFPAARSPGGGVSSNGGTSRGGSMPAAAPRPPARPPFRPRARPMPLVVHGSVPAALDRLGELSSAPPRPRVSAPGGADGGSSPAGGRWGQAASSRGGGAGALGLSGLFERATSRGRLQRQERSFSSNGAMGLGSSRARAAAKAKVISQWISGGRLTMWGGGGRTSDNGTGNGNDGGGGKSLSRAPTGVSLLAGEDKETGAVSWAVYGSYLRCLGAGLTVVVAAGLLAGEAAYLAADWWLALWAAAEPAEQAQPRWQWVYALLTGLVLLVSVARTILLFEAAVTAANRLHDTMLSRVLRAPLSFFHTNPAGRIINRFSKDQGLVDDLLPGALVEASDSGILVAGALVLVAVAVPLVVPLFLPLAAAFWWVRRRYITASREVKRWEAVTYSPLYTYVAATCKGLPTIRAYGAGGRFHRELLRLLSLSAEWGFASNAAASWIGLRLDTISAGTLLLASVMAVLVRDRINVEVLALALTHCLSVTTMMQYFVQQTAEVENHMTSVERMVAYTQLPSEPPAVAEGGGQPPPGWPRSGALRFDDVSAAYQPGLPPVLRGLTFAVPAGASCGVVGRTGSGKSSLLLTLFRMVELTHGSILLDGVDIAAVGLDALRRHLAVIPQDPLLFGGSLRSNLDPWGAHSSDDAALWAALRAVRLGGAVSALPGGLDARVAAGGANLSAGQRQLLCLARAMLQRAKVLALDEATANVDAETDEAVQLALGDFLRDGGSHGGGGGGGPAAAAGGGDGGGCVALVIAHRLDTVMDLDQLLVLADGRLEECGPPRTLLRGGGSLSHMAAAAASVSVPVSTRSVVVQRLE
ncbi:hypothetical protein HXX76_014988 [Chlamydomonas incerta]|uniref:Uncharacterized protein n=1 Tax=Chlamydomonas incerta TaxID=51695 RepID=A0A835SI22_CHLIN|nr:hypothetical protein HXX76_014988 [Chlamydomonas incerta]|eukprot:KAG2423828.1 hypothetical protein HXX76_014988 [Chlamydomonas incerta]